jgi:hypothetical protein
VKWICWAARKDEYGIGATVILSPQFILDCKPQSWNGWGGNALSPRKLRKQRNYRPNGDDVPWQNVQVAIDLTDQKPQNGHPTRLT